MNKVILIGRLVKDPDIRMGTNNITIARYNLEEENAALLEELKKHKDAIANLEQKEEVLRDRFRKAIATFKEIMENGYYDDGKDEDEDEWE